jgi:hypothetical protein
MCTDSRLFGDHVTPSRGSTDSASDGVNNTIFTFDESAFECGTTSQTYSDGYDNLYPYNDLDGQSEVRQEPAALAALARSDITLPCLDPAMFYTPTHLPTVMIEYWFSDVCPMWCIFDSDANYNRRFALRSWASSEPVFFAMQSMSAACMLDTLPTLTPVLSGDAVDYHPRIPCRATICDLCYGNFFALEIWLRDGRRADQGRPVHH